MSDVEASQRRETVPEPPPTHHGNTVAAWVCVAIIIVGAAIASIGVATLTLWVVCTGFVVVIIGLVTGKVLQVMGFGSVPVGSGRTGQRRA